MMFLVSLALVTADPTWAYDAKGDDIIPQVFQGKWAPGAADCASEDGVNVISISATGLEAYDFRAKLLKHAGFNTEHTSTDEMAEAVTMLVAESGEGEVSIGRIRLGMLGGKLYFDRPGEKTTTLDTKRGSYLRCPVRRG